MLYMLILHRKRSEKKGNKVLGQVIRKGTFTPTPFCIPLNIGCFKSSIFSLVLEKPPLIILLFYFFQLGRWPKVYVQKRWMSSSNILHQFCLTTHTSQDYDPSSVVYVSKLARAIWRYLPSEFCALLCCSFCQFFVYFYDNNAIIFRRILT